MDIIDNLKKYMYKNDITIQEISVKLKVSPNHFGMVLRGERNLSERMTYKINELLANEIGGEN